MPTDILAEIESNLPDNARGQITAAITRLVLGDIEKDAGALRHFDTKASFVAAGADGSAANVFAGTQYVRVASVLAPSDTTPTAPLMYARGTATPTGIWGEVLAAGIYWTPLYDTEPVNVAQWGYQTNVSFSNNQPIPGTGTDMQPVIQAAIDWAIQNAYPVVTLPSGPARTNDTIHIGYGNTNKHYISLTLDGRGGPPFAPSLAGAMLCPANTDRPCINIQAARIVNVRNIYGAGLNYQWVANNRLQTGPGTLDSLSSSPADWLDPAITPTGSNPGGLQVHSPYAFITVDAYKGAAPADAYPQVNYPAWSGPDTQYNKGLSSQVNIDNCMCTGFAVGFVGSPNGDGNGDFINVRGCSVNYGVYGVAICNTQSRNVGVRDTNFVALHTWLTGRAFGQGLGLFGGELSNLSGGHAYQVLDFPVTATPGMTINTIYCEVGVRVGTFGSSAGSSANTVTINSLYWNGGEEIHGSIPVSLFVVPANMCLTLNDMTANNNTTRLLPLVTGGGSLVIHGGNFYGTNFRLVGATFGSAAFQRALNFTGGIALPLHSATGPNQNQSSVQWLGETNAIYQTNPTDTLSNSQRLSRRMVWDGRVRQQMTQSCQEFADLTGASWRILAKNNQVTVAITDAGTFPVGPVLTGDVLTFSVAGALQENNVQINFTPGDLFFHISTGTLFVVTTVGAKTGGNYPITCLQMNNMQVDPTTLAMTTQRMSDPTFTVGTCLLQRCGPVMPQQVEFGTFTSGSTAVSNVSRGDGYGGNLSTYYIAGDAMTGYVFSAATNADKWPIGALNSIASVTNGSPGSAVLSANATQSGDFPIYPLPIAR
jgi:hypothetical protein